MSQVMQPMALDLNLPWQVDAQREDSFKKIVKWILVPLLVLFLVVPFLPKIDSAYDAEDDLAVRTQILLDPVAEPEEEPVVPEPEPEPEVQAEPEPAAPAPSPEASPEPAPTPETEPEPTVDSRQSVAESQGMTELSSQLDAMRGAVNVQSMENKNLSDNESGEVARAERARLGQELTTRSSGTVVDETVMTSEITGLSAHESTQVEGLSLSDMPPGSQRSHVSGQTGQRDMESIRRTLEQARGNIYSLYQRALNDEPGLTGEFTFKLVIEPNGSVSELTLLVSELGISQLESDILERIRAVEFGEMDVPPTVVEYRFVFLPS